MTRRDPGTASGGVAVEPGRCGCGGLEPLHTRTRSGRRGGCPATGCHRYEPASNVIAFPGAGTTPAPAGPPTRLPDLDAMGERYAAYCEARDSGREREADLLARAVAEDVPAWLAEVARVEALRAELAAELDRVTGRD